MVGKKTLEDAKMTTKYLIYWYQRSLPTLLVFAYLTFIFLIFFAITSKVRADEKPKETSKIIYAAPKSISQPMMNDAFKITFAKNIQNQNSASIEYQITKVKLSFKF